MLTRIANRVMSKSVTCSASTSVQRICQSGILPEGSTSAYYGIYNLDYSKLSSKSGRAKLLSAIKSFPSVLENVSESMQTQTVGTVSFGKKAWEYLASGREDLLKVAEDLVSFPGYGMAAATQISISISTARRIRPRSRRRNWLFPCSTETMPSSPLSTRRMVLCTRTVVI